MHTRTVERLTAAGLVAAVLTGTVAANALAEGTPQPPVVVTRGDGKVQIGLVAPGGGSAAPAGKASGGGGSGGSKAAAAGSGGAYQGGSSVSSNPFFMGDTPADPTTGLSAPCPAAGPAVCTVPQQPAAPAAAPAPAPAAPAAPPPPSAFSLAVAAFGELVMPRPVPSRYPSGTLKTNGHPYTIVNANTWFWTDPATWQPVSKTVTAGAVWGTATATPARLSFTPGDGSRPVPCPGPGSPWKANEQTWLAPVNPQGCSYRYPKSSLGVGGDDQVSATYTITWNVSWSGSDGSSGTFNNMQTSTTSRFAVAEVQTVIVK